MIYISIGTYVTYRFGKFVRLGLGLGLVRAELGTVLLSQLTLFTRKTLKWEKLYVKTLSSVYSGGSTQVKAAVSQRSILAHSGRARLE